MQPKADRVLHLTECYSHRITGCHFGVSYTNSRIRVTCRRYCIFPGRQDTAHAETLLRHCQHGFSQIERHLRLTGVGDQLSLNLMTRYVDHLEAQAGGPVAEAERHSIRHTVWSPGPHKRTPVDEQSELTKLEAGLATTQLDDQIRMADEVLDVLAARGILHVMFEQGRLGYFYDSAREVLTDNGYGVITKKEAFAFWSIYMRGGNNPNEREHMERNGYTPAVRALLEKPYLDLGAMLTIDKAYACDPERSGWACEVFGLRNDPVWDFLRAKAVQVLHFEALLKEHGINR